MLDTMEWRVCVKPPAVTVRCFELCTEPQWRQEGPYCPCLGVPVSLGHAFTFLPVSLVSSSPRRVAISAVWLHSLLYIQARSFQWKPGQRDLKGILSKTCGEKLSFLIKKNRLPLCMWTLSWKDIFPEAIAVIWEPAEGDKWQAEGRKVWR